MASSSVAPSTKFGAIPLDPSFYILHRHKEVCYKVYARFVTRLFEVCYKVYAQFMRGLLHGLCAVCYKVIRGLSQGLYEVCYKVCRWHFFVMCSWFVNRIH